VLLGTVTDVVGLRSLEPALQHVEHAVQAKPTFS
jgi:hypothetical protein